MTLSHWRLQELGAPLMKNLEELRAAMQREREIAVGRVREDCRREMEVAVARARREADKDTTLTAANSQLQEDIAFLKQEVEKYKAAYAKESKRRRAVHEKLIDSQVRVASWWRALAHVSGVCPQPRAVTRATLVSRTVVARAVASRGCSMTCAGQHSCAREGATRDDGQGCGHGHDGPHPVQQRGRDVAQGRGARRRPSQRGSPLRVRRDPPAARESGGGVRGGAAAVRQRTGRLQRNAAGVRSGAVMPVHAPPPTTVQTSALSCDDACRRRDREKPTRWRACLAKRVSATEPSSRCSTWQLSGDRTLSSSSGCVLPARVFLFDSASFPWPRVASQVSMLEVYMERIRDLLDDSTSADAKSRRARTGASEFDSDLQVREVRQRAVVVSPLPSRRYVCRVCVYMCGYVWIFMWILMRWDVVGL